MVGSTFAASPSSDKKFTAMPAPIENPTKNLSSIIVSKHTISRSRLLQRRVGIDSIVSNMFRHSPHISCIGSMKATLGTESTPTTASVVHHNYKTAAVNQ